MQPTYLGDATSLVFQGSLIHKAVLGMLMWRKVNTGPDANTHDAARQCQPDPT
jgi:hypothetical protein